MKIMISQPMRGKTEKEIRRERELMKAQLETDGHEVIDTIFSEEPQGNCTPGLFYLAKSINTMSKVDAVVFLPGWEEARGCKIEYEVAKKYGKYIKIL